MAKKVALVSCVKSKREVPSPACDLYASQLFQGMRRYAEQNADAWFILSAEHGVLSPDEVIAPYEKTLNKMGKAARSQWSARVVRQLSETLVAGTAVIILAGKRYRDGIIPALIKEGYEVEVPLAGLSFGRQLRWLKEHS
ncbi:MAG: DUF6884 domain-containing protein [Candidatus Dechloromonas phosphoritropha]|jgi:cytoplasmic iron level regulating protein YaaA (DUF328/UPF0246 family)